MRSSTAAARATPSQDRSTAAAYALALAAAGLLVWHRALGTFFSQDDFAKLATTVGLAPRLHGAWRILGNQLAFDALHALAGLDPLPYHALSLAAHLGCALALFTLLGRRISRHAAFAGALFFLVHPALFSAVYWISTLADSLALLFALAALTAVEEAGPRRWLSLPLFALSLLSKESTILLPVAAAGLARAAPPRPGASRSGPASAPHRAGPVLGAMAVIAIAYLAYFALSAYPTYFVPAGHGAAPGSPAGPAYALAAGGRMLTNLLTLTGWSVNVALPTVRGFSDAVDPGAYPWALGAIAVWLIGCGSRALRRNGWVAGGVLYLTLVLPVLPLAHHTYHYYLDAPLAGTAWCVAAAVETGTARRAAPARVLAVGALAALLTLNGWALVRRIETMPFLSPELRSEPIIDRARIAARVYGDLGAANLPSGTRLAFWSPSLVALGRSGGRDTTQTYFEGNVRSALLDGLAVRVMFPGVDSVVFVRAYRPLPDPWRYAVYRLDGSLRVAGSAELDTVLTRFPGARPGAPPG